MNFYSELCKVYDIVFEKDETTVNFLKKGLKGSSEILDLGCGTGTYSIELSKDGHSVTGIDLDEAMIEKAKVKAGNNPVKFYYGDMMEFKKITSDKPFDMIFCIGNTLVHLRDKGTIRELFKRTYDSLKSGGSMVVQIINYDRIIDKGITSLPIIDKSSDGVKFIRNYNLHEDKRKVDFNTQLIVSSGGQEEIYKNSVPLLALRSEEMEELFKDAGFTSIMLYGGFNESSYSKDSYALVVRCIK